MKKRNVTKSVKIILSTALSAVLILTSLFVTGGTVSAEEILKDEDLFVAGQNEYEPIDDVETEFFAEDNEPDVYFAKVDNTGLVTAVAKGTATITATTTDGTAKTATCKITVRVPVTGVALNITSASIAKGNTLQLTATVKPTNASNKNVTWKSSNTAVAKVSSTGLVTAVAKGSATITAVTKQGSKTATCKVTVKDPVAVTGVSLNMSTVTVAKGSKIQLTATVTPSNAYNKNVTWKSNYSRIAKVDSNGLVTAVSSGRAAITVTTKESSFTARCVVIVN